MTGGNVKLQWKPDFGARWSALNVDFEIVLYMKKGLELNLLESIIQV